MKPLHELCLHEAVTLLARREISAVEVTRACLERINAREPTVQAWQFIDHERALEEAKAADAKPTKPLYGLPIGVKDIIDTSDMPTEYGTSIHRGHQPDRDAAAVAALRRAGAVILGKTVTTELAYFTPGKTKNPSNPEHTPGGSSSGSAAAVADLMVPAALGTQTAGSVIRPASFCGVIGYKPTFGVFPMSGIKPLAPSLDTLGLFTRAVPDLAVLWEALTGHASPPHTPRTPPHIALCRTDQWPIADADSQRVLLETADRLRKTGARVDDFELGEGFRGTYEAQKLIMAVEMARSLATERESHADKLGPKLLELFREADASSPEAYSRSLGLAEECRRQMRTVFTRYDVLMTPSAPGEAPELSSTGDPAFNRVWTLLHLPCINLPLGRGQRGLPIGIQLVGDAGGDARLLAFATWVLSHLGGGRKP